MWWTSRKGSWPPHPAEDASGKTADPLRPAGRLRGEQRSSLGPGYYVECHASWHDAAMPDHARRALRLR